MLIEAGLDGLHAIQPCCYGINLEELKANLGNRILFNGAIDSHHVLIEGTPDVENVLAMFDTIREYGTYNKPLKCAW